jgi:hypothetical protein
VKIQQLRFLAAVAQNDLNITADRDLVDRAADCETQEEVDTLFAGVQLAAR